MFVLHRLGASLILGIVLFSFPARAALHPAPTSSFLDGLVWQLCIPQMLPDAVVENYLFAIYEATPKIDKTGDFTWKDAYAAQLVGMDRKTFVIGGVEAKFKRALYCMFRAMEANGIKAGITSAFRNNFRQFIAGGQRNAPGETYHGGDKVTLGYGYGIAVDIVSLHGSTRAEQLASNPVVWKWIDRNGELFGVGRPYLDRDAPHVTPRTSPEYAAHYLASLRKAILAAMTKTKKKNGRHTKRQ